MATHHRTADTGDAPGVPPREGAAAVPGQHSGNAAAKARASRRKPKIGIKCHLKPIAIGTGARVVLTAGSAWLYYEHLNSNIQTSKKNLSGIEGKRTAPNAFGQVPLNILLLGSDSRATERARQLGGGKNLRNNPPLADVQMLLHVSADRSNASIVSIPRDTMVDIPECRSEDGKQDFKATPVHPHQRIVGARRSGLHPRHLDTAHRAEHRPLHDDRLRRCGGIGLKLPAGDNVLDADQSLLWLRTRDAWGSDINRTKAQHMYLNSLVRSLKSNGTLTDPGKLMDLAEAATKAIKPDDGLDTVKKLYDLGTELRKVPTNRITSLTARVLPDPRNPKATVVLDKAAADRIWQMLLTDVPLDKNGKKKAKSAPPTASTTPAPAVDRASVAVTVQNGTGIKGRALTIATALTGAGFGRAAVGTPGNAAAQSATTVTFDAAHKTEAQAVAAALKLPATALRQSASAGAPVLVIGADWTTGSSFPVQQTPKAGDLPDSVAAKNAADTKDCMQVMPQGRTYTY